MRKFIRDQIIEILSTIKEGVVEAEKDKLVQNRIELLESCSQGLAYILNLVKDGFSSERFLEYEEIFKQQEESLSSMISLVEQGEKTDKIHRSLKKALEKLQEKLRNDSEVQLEIVFLPYKVSMWDSFSSILRAAKEDPHCICYVVPIPYYDKDEHGKFKELHYEGDNFPSEVEVIHYKNYDITKRQPDIAYIHNPYDGNNYVTSIHPDYYSYELKKSIGTLVYVPYCLHGATNNGAINTTHYSEVTKAADYAICQSQFDQKIFAHNGTNIKKLLPLGNPKLDEVVYQMEHPPHLPESWAEKIQGKKVILYNLTISYLLHYNIEYVYDQINQILENEQVVLLFRPHPLLPATFESMRKGMYHRYLDFLETLENHPRVIIDEEQEVFTSFYYSDGLITSKSSILINYMLTEKPILMLDINPLNYFPRINQKIDKVFRIYDCTKVYFTKITEPFMYHDELVPINKAPLFWKKEEDTTNSSEEIWTWKKAPTDTPEIDEKMSLVVACFQEKKGKYYRNSCKEFRDAWDYNNPDSGFGITLIDNQEFIEMILNGSDPQKEERMATFRNRAVNCQGKNGENVHKYIMNSQKK